MTNKYKISELAKDFGLTSKDIIKIIAEKTGADKKSSTALDEKSFASSTELSALMIIFRIDDFCRNRIVYIKLLRFFHVHLSA